MVHYLNTSSSSTLFVYEETKILTGMFSQLFDKLFATPQQKYFMTWYDTEFFLFQVLNSCPLLS